MSTPSPTNGQAPPKKKRALSRETPRTLLLYDCIEAGLWLSMSAKSVGRLARDGKIPSFKIGDLRRFRHDDLVAYVRNLDQGATS